MLEEHDAHRIFPSGASACGSLAAALGVRLTELRLPMPAGMMLISPEVDLTESGDSFTTLRDVSVGLQSMRQVNLLYADGVDLADPHLSPSSATSPDSLRRCSSGEPEFCSSPTRSACTAPSATPASTPICTSSTPALTLAPAPPPKKQQSLERSDSSSAAYHAALPLRTCDRGSIVNCYTRLSCRSIGNDSEAAVLSCSAVVRGQLWFVSPTTVYSASPRGRFARAPTPVSKLGLGRSARSRVGADAHRCRAGESE
ncbi:alpha/beta hydrolase fold domain-containing protein [Agromyces subbeticus]|uniref:alpha/beta hydrolase fold domain-containing protein n=1 Tax=Agromyces subbeticus TaxID=293890 RepID=UPI00146F6C60